MKKILVAAAALSCLPGVAFAQDEKPVNLFDGLRVEARLGYETPTVSGDDDIYKIGSAVSYGGEIGFDLAVSSKATVGPFVNYEFSGVKVCEGSDCLKVQGNLAAGARIGFEVSPKVALYGKLGYAQLSLKASSGTLSATDDKGGVYGAIGAEFALAKNAYVNVEMAYADLGEFYVSDYHLQRRHVAAGVGFRF